MNLSKGLDIMCENRVVKVGIEINDMTYSEICFSKPLEGNPGIGGADYMLLLLAHCLNLFSKTIDVTVFQTGDNNTYPPDLKVINLANDGMSAILKNQIDIYIANASARDNLWYEFFEKNNIKLILRAANFPTAEKLRQYNTYKCIKRIVFLGGQEYDTYLDDDIMFKSCIIENMHKTIAIQERRTENLENVVTYMGSLVPQKGFHFLAKNWKKIIAEVPDAKLYVVGSGKLYDNNKLLGKYGVAENEYEEQFMGDLLNAEGALLESVVFFGRLQGEEIKKVLRCTKVGVPNPIGETETFCNCAIEMQSMGIPVVTIAGYSFFDVVDDNKTGLLYKKEEDFSKYIIQLLKDNEKNKKMGWDAGIFADKFSIDNILPKWEKCIFDVYNDKPVKYLGYHGHLLYNKKYLTLLNRWVRMKFHMKKLRSRRGE